MSYLRIPVLAVFAIASLCVVTAAYALLGLVEAGHSPAGANSGWGTVIAASTIGFAISLLILVRRTPRVGMLAAILSIFSFAALVLFAAFSLLFFTSWSAWIAIGSVSVAYTSWAFVVLVRSLRSTPTARTLRLSIFGAVGYTILATLSCLDSGGLQGVEMLVPFIAFYLAACHPLTLLVLRFNARAAA